MCHEGNRGAAGGPRQIPTKNLDEWLEPAANLRVEVGLGALARADNKVRFEFGRHGTIEEVDADEDGEADGAVGL